MPRGKASAAGAGVKKPRGPKAQKLPDSFAPGTILGDLRKKEWKLGKEIGQGGFGLIYLANENGCPVESNAPYVVKIEPHSNGPLFCELHYYQRVAKADMIEAWKKTKKLKYLGLPKFIATGSYMRANIQYRFMVMERFGSDVQKLFEGAGKRFETHTVYCLALRMIDALEYMHHNGYVHADIKASNMLLGFRAGKQQPDEVYLVDYGLAVKYQRDGEHKAYKEDKRMAHDGTIEFTSTDAHLGVAPSRRGDMEILGFCLLQWLCGRLPWESNLTNKDFVAGEKFKYTKNISSLMKACFSDGNIPDEVQKYFEMVKKLQYDECPNYESMKTLFRKGLKRLGVKDEWKLDLPLNGPVSPKKAVKRKSTGVEAASSAPKQKAVVKTTSATKQKESTPKRKVATLNRNKTGVQSPKVVPSPRAVKSPRGIIPGRPSPSRIIPGRPTLLPKSPKAAAIRVKSPISNGGKKKATTTKRRVKRRKVATVDVSMQTSPP
ncbi:serine/threonine-protein kinase VRK1-like isoform X2 [Pecten maximus]|uniref:serine/threonine-protein kinase VRK1-like isoform X2 n=1 Tax=Pecten maximus TaxID=6579 RepID=UPI00145916D9|nr:serine/threonine-protein kinase VRK1-like isoform X2 [Pecten maximus]